ncbi:FecR family protein [Variovorax sp. LT1R16]|uniref:FecR family protein n=1 Tax=Variovorax sp. LT1R16 TaxID=3443728 RepID=UPI003F484AB7
MEHAATWFSVLQSGEATDVDRTRWQTWMDSSAEHRQAWVFVERISQRFQPIQASPAPRLAVDAYDSANARLARRRLLLSVAGTAGSGLLGWRLWRHTPLPDLAMAWVADHRTGTGEMRQTALLDGTNVWLNTASAFDQYYSADLRRLRLRTGEILIETAPDPTRPFVVDTPHGRLRALGTRFTTRMEGDDTFIAVYDGAVEVKTAGSGDTLLLRAGRQARFDASAIAAAEPADPAREAWRRGILLANGIPLSEVVSELRPYHAGHLALASEIADLPVLGSYPLNDTDRALAMLRAVLPIQTRQPLPWWTTIEAHAPEARSTR